MRAIATLSLIAVCFLSGCLLLLSIFEAPLTKAAVDIGKNRAGKAIVPHHLKKQVKETIKKKTRTTTFRWDKKNPPMKL